MSNLHPQTLFHAMRVPSAQNAKVASPAGYMEVTGSFMGLRAYCHRGNTAPQNPSWPGDPEKKVTIIAPRKERAPRHHTYGRYWCVPVFNNKSTTTDCRKFAANQLIAK